MPRDIAVTLGLISEKDALALVISHDCDIASEDLDEEPDIEIMIGSPIAQLDGNYTHAKNSRRLHLELRFKDSSVQVELRAARKIRVQKKSLVTQSPDSNYILGQLNQRILRSWLAARYSRAALPNALNERLRPVEKAFLSLGKNHPHAVLGIFIDYDPHETELGDGEHYEIWLSVVYSTENPEYATQATKASAALTSAFEKAFKAGENWEKIELRACTARAENEFSLRDLHQTLQYRLEHASYKKEPPARTVDII